MTTKKENGKFEKKTSVAKKVEKKKSSLKSSSKNEQKKEKFDLRKINPRFYIIGGIIFIIIIVSIVVCFFLPKNAKKQEEEEKKLEEKAKNLEEQLLIYAKQILKEEDFSLVEDRTEYTAYILLSDMELEYQKDIQMFQTEDLTCDLFDTYVLFTSNEEGITYTPHLSCTRPSEEKEDIPSSSESLSE